MGSTPIARHVLRDGHRGTASGCRRSAGPRTTWSCCPTPTSTWRPTPRSAPGSARRASGAWPSRSWSRSTPSATTWSPPSPSGPRACSSPTAARPAPTWARWSPRAHRDRVALLRRPRRRGGRASWSSTAATSSSTARPTASGSGPACSTTSPPDMRIYIRGDLRAGALRRAGAELRGGRRAGQRPLRLRQRRRRSSPTTAARPAASSTRSRSGWSASTCPIPVPVAYHSFGGWKASLFGDTTCPRHRGRALLHPGEDGHRPLGRPLDPGPGPRLPAQRLTRRARLCPAGAVRGRWNP